MDHMADRCTRLQGYAQDEVQKDLEWMRERKADLHLKMMKSACLQVELLHHFNVSSLSKVVYWAIYQITNIVIYP